MSEGHHITVYSCGHIQSQCRCPDPSKVRKTLDYPCAGCAERTNEVVYFVIHNSEGDTHVERLSKDELQKRLDERYYGNVRCMDAIATTDTNYWGESILIIKGSIAVPAARETVVQHQLP